MFSATLMVASWGIFALSFVANGRVDHSDALFLLFLWIAASRACRRPWSLCGRGAVRRADPLLYPLRFSRQHQRSGWLS